MSKAIVLKNIRNLSEYLFINDGYLETTGITLYLCYDNYNKVNELFSRHCDIDKLGKDISETIFIESEGLKTTNSINQEILDIADTNNCHFAYIYMNGKWLVRYIDTTNQWTKWVNLETIVQELFIKDIKGVKNV